MRGDKYSEGVEGPREVSESEVRGMVRRARTPGRQLLKLECDCGHIIRASRKLADDAMPLCPQCGREYKIVEKGQ